jgi:hypothetical protein
MPAVQRGQAYKLKSGQWGIRYYDANGIRRKQSPFPSKSAAFAWFREQVEPTLRGEVPPKPDATLSEFVVLYLDRHSAEVRSRTISTLRERLSHAERKFGNIPLRELERMVDEIAAWHARQPRRVRYGRMGRCARRLVLPYGGAT